MNEKWRSQSYREEQEAKQSFLVSVTLLCINIIIMFILSGCAETQVPVVLSAVSESGDIVSTISAATSTASVEKERMLMDAYKNRDVQRQKMYSKSGFKMTWEGKEVVTTTTVIIDNKPVTITQKTTQFNPVISYKEEPEFDQPLPAAPSIHPVWKASTDIAGIIAKYGLIGWGISELGDLLSTGFTHAGDSFAGEAYLLNSKNSAGTSQTFSLTNPITSSKTD